MGLKLKFVGDVTIPEGRHTGVISRIEQRTKEQGFKYNYTDIYITLDEEGLEGTEIRYGCPTPSALSKRNRLGRLVLLFKPDLQVGEEIDIEELLVGKRVSFVTTNRETEQGVFARIVEDSIKPEENNNEKPKETKQQKMTEVSEPKVQKEVVQ